MPASEATVIKLYGGIATPDGKRLFITKLDGSLSTLVNCECVVLIVFVPPSFVQCDAVNAAR
jgi:hypothetical protein